MTTIKNHYLVPTIYGINLLVETHSGEWYQQVHTTLCRDGGGVARWEKLEVDENLQPKVLNMKED